MLGRADYREHGTDVRFWLLWASTFVVVFLAACVVLPLLMDDLGGVRGGIAGGVAGGFSVAVATFDHRRRLQRADGSRGLGGDEQRQ